MRLDCPVCKDETDLRVSNFEFPVKVGVARSEMVQSWGEFTPDTIGLAEVAAKRPEALKLIEEVNFDG